MIFNTSCDFFDIIFKSFYDDGIWLAGCQGCEFLKVFWGLFLSKIDHKVDKGVYELLKVNLERVLIYQDATLILGSFWFNQTFNMSIFLSGNETKLSKLPLLIFTFFANIWNAAACFKMLKARYTLK